MIDISFRSSFDIYEMLLALSVRPFVPPLVRSPSTEMALPRSAASILRR
ncbi:hypothetical protein [Thermogymnomonas acidicola]|nr:hypothetical protein [Thermogymnomonas acidicola]